MNAQSAHAPENEALARFVLNEMENSVLYGVSEDERKLFRELNGFTVDISKTMVRTEKLETIRMSPFPVPAAA